MLSAALFSPFIYDSCTTSTVRVLDRKDATRSNAAIG